MLRRGLTEVVRASPLSGGASARERSLLRPLLMRGAGVGAVHIEAVVGVDPSHPTELLAQAAVVLERLATVDTEHREGRRARECLAALRIRDVIAVPARRLRGRR